MVKYRLVYEDRGVMALFQRLAAKLGDPLPITEDMARRLEASVQANFDAQGRPDRWAPLSFAAKVAWHTGRKSFWTKRGSRMTAAGRAAWEGRKVLTDTGRLRRSIRAKAYKNRVEIGTTVKYAIFHQEGTRKMPARPFLLVQRSDWDYFVRRWERWLAEAAE